MKKVLLVVVVMLMGVRGWGQVGILKHSLSIGFGFKSINQLDKGTATDLFSPTTMPGIGEISNIKPGMQLFLSFGFRCHKKNSTELTLGYCTYKADKTYPTPGDWKMNSLVLMYNWKRSYLKKESLQFYGLLGGGFIFKKMNYTSTWGAITSAETSGMTLAWQASPLCIRYGKIASVFAELGYGYKGLLNIGGSVGL